MNDFEAFVLQDFLDGDFLLSGGMDRADDELGTEDDAKGAVPDDVGAGVADLALLACSAITGQDLDEFVRFIDCGMCMCVCVCVFI
jgi:hypothetical protein